MHSKIARRRVVLALGILFAGAVACGEGEPTAKAGGAVVCEPGTTTSCYTGPAPTQGVGACKAGVATCTQDGQGYGPCVGEVVPTRELCNGGVDDDCDGTPEPADSVACEPGTGSCNGNVGTSCPDGLHLVTAECDPLQGMTCNATSGTCEGPCSSASLGTGSLGCDFYPTVTANPTEVNSFGVVVTNDSDDPVSITISKGSETLESRTIAAHAGVTIELPWVTQLKGPDFDSRTGMPASARVDQGSYRLRSTRPVTVHQFSPAGGYDSADASLLLPVNAWGDRYRVVARAHSGTYSGLYAITASEDGTTVEVAAPPGGVLVKSGVAGIATTGAGTLTLNRGDVVQVVTAGGSNDPTGTLVTANKPIQVIGGHECAQVPADVGFCDHLEETVVPLSMAAKRYIVAGPVLFEDPGPDQIVRILATEPDTKLSYAPAQPDAPSSIAAAGAWVEFRTSKELEIVADRPVIVAEYQVGSSSERRGQPSLTFALPLERYKPEWTVYMPATSFAGVIDVVAPLGTVVHFDGELIASLSPIGQSGFGVARKEVYSPRAPGEMHRLSANAPIGVDVYGDSGGSSYWYPAEIPSTR